MKLLNTIKLAGIGGALMLATGAHAASLNVDVDIDLPNAMILYAPSQIDLDVTSAAVLAYLNNGGTAYVSGDTATLSNPAPFSVSAPSVDAGIQAGVGEVGANQNDTTVAFSIGNAFGVRSIGYSSLNASVSCTSNCGDMSGVGTNFAGTASPILQSGSIDFTYDIVGGDVTATFQISVTGT